MPGPVFAVHLAQNRIGSRLQRRMDMLRDARRFRHQAEQIVGEIHRFDGTQAKTFDVRLGEQSAQQIGEPHRASRFPAPPSEIDSRQTPLRGISC